LDRNRETARLEQPGRLVIALSQKQQSFLMRGMGAFAVVLVVMLAVGTFADYQIAQAIYAPDNPLVIFVSTLGLFPMAYPACFLLGVLMQRSLASQKTPLLRVVGAVLCVVLAMLFGALITRAVLSVRDGFGGMTGHELPTLARMGIGVVAGGGLCALGFGAGKSNDAKDLARRVLLVVVVLVASYVVIELVKGFMARPRPRTLFAGHEGIAFSPWYSKTSGTQEFMAAFGLEKDAFKSFPSGHSLQAASFLAAFYGLSLVYPGLRQKLGIALAVEIVFTLTIMACRMILGAHFLSDVSVGALVGVVAFLVLLSLQARQPRQS
jgi:membrane-associated phospholipid phosphatase